MAKPYGHQHFWPGVPEDVKIWMRAGITARAAGQSPREAVRHANAELKRWHDLNAQLIALGLRKPAEGA